MAERGQTCYISVMSKSRSDIKSLIEAPPPARPTEPSYAEWLRAQLEHAAADLRDGKEAAIEHDQVFAELDRMIAKHERR